MVGLAESALEESGDDGNDEPTVIVLDGISLHLFGRVMSSAPDVVKGEVAPESNALELGLKALAVGHGSDYFCFDDAAFDQAARGVRVETHRRGHGQPVYQTA